MAIANAFNHIHAAALTTDAQPAATPNRRALVLAGDDGETKATVARLLDQFGFDTVDAGPLEEAGGSSRILRGMVLGGRPTRYERTWQLRRDVETSDRPASSPWRGPASGGCCVRGSWWEAISSRTAAVPAFP